MGVDASTARHGSFDQGWNRHPGPDPDWEEVSIALQLPSRSLIDVSVRGLRGDPRAKILLEDRLLAEGDGPLVARTWIDRGSRRMAIRRRSPRGSPRPLVGDKLRVVKDKGNSTQ